MRNLQYVFSFLAVTTSLFLVVVFNSPSAYAADARQFNAGRIIDDVVFTNSNSMTVQDIQNFFNSKVTCDTWGVKTSELGEGTRRQWMANRGIYPPFRCVTDYYENPANGQSNYGKNDIPAGAISAAQIVYNYSKQYNINPQAILATLQKENGMITDEWPTPKQFTEAMGFGCPDNVAPGSPACDPTYKSFATQIYQATRHFRGYMDNQYCDGNWCTPYRVGQSTIKWNPNSSCGSSSVYIENKATSALYSYTPYRPNQSALNAQYGLGDGCGSYGNRNFYLYFTDWFGATLGAVNIVSPLTVKSEFSHGLFTNKIIQAQFTLKNNSAQRQDIGTIAIGVRSSTNFNYDFGSQRIILEPGQQYVYTATRTIDLEDTYTFNIINYRDGEGWSDTYPDSINNYSRIVSNAVVQNMPTVTSGPSVDSALLHVQEASTVRYTVKNNSKYAANLGYMGVAVTSPSGKNADLPFDTVSSLAPGATYEYYKQFTPGENGIYKARISSTGDNGMTWSEGRYPSAAVGTNRVDVLVKSNPTLTQGLALSNTNPRAGETVTGTFKVKNFGNTTVVVNKKICYIMRDEQYNNNDIGCLDIASINPGQEIVYTGDRVIGKSGQYKAHFAMYDGKYWYDNWSFEQETGVESRTLSFSVKSNPTLTQGLALSNISPKSGDTINGQFKVANRGNTEIIVNKNLCFIIRDTQNRNNDLGCLYIATLQPGQELAYTGSRVLVAGSYRAYFAMNDGKYWYDNWSFEQETGTEPKTLTFTIAP